MSCRNFKKIIFFPYRNPNDNYTNVTWKPSTPENPCHLVVGKTLEIRENVLNEERFDFWKEVKKMYIK